MGRDMHQNRGRPPVATQPRRSAEKPRTSSTKKTVVSRTRGDNKEQSDLAEMRNALLLAAFPIESSDSSWIVATDDSILRKLPIAAEKYREHLKSLTKQELSARYQSFKKSKRYGLLVEANCRSACRKPFWTAEEATFYSFGLEFPEAFGLSVIQHELDIALHGKVIDSAKRSRPFIFSIPEDHRFLAHILERLDFIQRAVAINELPEKIKPGQFIRWAERRGIGLPHKLISGAKDVAAEIEDFQDRYEAAQKALKQGERDLDALKDRYRNEITDLKKEIARLENLNETLIRTGDGPRLRRSESLKNAQIILVCMAREKYGWNNSMDAVARQIAAATASYLDGGLSPDTVKRNLKRGQALIDGTKRQPSVAER